MKVSRLLRILVVTVIAGACFGTAIAQDVREEKVSTPAEQTPQTSLGDSPIRIERRKPNLVGQSSEGKVSFLFFNATGKPIRAFSYATVTGDDTRLAVSVYNKGHDPELILLGSLFSDQEDPRFVFDWILFTDGSTWGPDEHHLSREIRDYLKGYHTARERVGELLGEPDAEPVMNFLDGPWQVSWGTPPAGTAIRTPDEKDFFLRGYHSAVSRLNDRDISTLELSRPVDEVLINRLKEMLGKTPRP